MSAVTKDNPLLSIVLGGTMRIIVIDGLSLVGKTTLCKDLYNHYTAEGMSCKYCHHGHLTNDDAGEQLYRQAIASYNSWSVSDAVKQSILSIQKDYEAYQATKHLFSDIDIILLDRHYMSQYVVARYFGVDTQFDFNRPENYFEFLITTGYAERLRRSAQRGDNHSRLTDYTLKSRQIHSAFEGLYKEYVRVNGISSDFVFCNDYFDIIGKVIAKINSLV